MKCVKNVSLLAIPMVMAVLATVGAAVGQDAPDKAERAKPRGRLPNYFSAVVDGSQRAEIYTIQGRYAKQLDDLQRQIEELKAKRNQEVDAVLTAEQLEIVNAKRAAAAEKRKARLEALKKAKAAATAVETESSQ